MQYQAVDSVLGGGRALALVVSVGWAQVLGAQAFVPGQPSRPVLSELQATPAPDAPDALQWLEGTIGYTYHNNCITGQVELLTGHYVGYYGNTDVTFPRVGDVYYGHIVIGTLGNPCAGPYVHVEAWPPPASDFVNSASYPIYCFYTSVAGQTSQITDGSCPTAASLTIGPYGGYNLDSRPAGSWPGGPWPLAQGAFLEIQFPMVSFQPLSGIATNSYEYGLVQALAGVSPIVTAKQGVFVAPAPGGNQCPASVKGDFSSDGRPDLIWRNQATNRHMFWTMNGASATQSRWLSPDPPAGYQAVGADDFNADNRSDLVLANPTSGAVEFWIMNGATRQGAAIPLGAPLLPPWKLSATGDWNGDGKPDLLWRNFSTQKIRIWTMNGTSKLGEIVPTPDQALDVNWEIVATLDYSGDGVRDLLWYNWSSGKIVLWTMNSSVQRITGFFTNPPNAGANNWKVLAGGEYSGSGAGVCSNDIVWRNADSGKSVLWQMDNAGNRVFGGFTAPDGPASDPSGQPTSPTDWILAGPR